MKKPANVEDLAAHLTVAATTPLVRPPANQDPAPTPVAAKPKAEKVSSKPVYLRVPTPLYDRYEAEAVNRTKATGKGVTIQQVILEKMEGPL